MFKAPPIIMCQAKWIYKNFPSINKFLIKLLFSKKESFSSCSHGAISYTLHTVPTDHQRWAQQMRIINETKYIINLVESLSIAKWSCSKENYAFATFCANVFCFVFFPFILFLKDEQMTHNTAVETFINGKVVERNSFSSKREKQTK